MKLILKYHSNMSHETNTILEEERIESERYYRIEKTERELKWALEATKDEPGLSIADIAKNIKKVFEPEEVEKLKQLL